MTSTALKVGPLFTRIKILSFGPQVIKFKKPVSYEVNLAAQSSHSEVLFLSKFWSNFCGYWSSRVQPLILWWLIIGNRKYRVK